jgi:hypothetical protein
MMVRTKTPSSLPLAMQRKPRKPNESEANTHPPLPLAYDVSFLYKDAQDGIRPGFTIVAENLPECMQFLDLVRDCISLFGLAPLPPNNLKADHDFGNSFRPNPYTTGYVAEDIRLHRKDTSVSKPRKTS